MLTLGLMEGVLSATLGILVLMILANENVPLHRIFGPMVTVIVGFTAYLIYDSGRVETGGDVVGLAFVAFVVFFAPLGLMRAAWKAVKAMEAPPAAQVASARPALIPAPPQRGEEQAAPAPEPRVA